MRYTVLDFETANNKRDSACALGIVVIENNQIVEEKMYLIKPYDMHFLGMNIAIHGIRPKDVENAPMFDELYHSIFKSYIEHQIVVAHNASFDMSVLRACLNHFDIPFPDCTYICTVKVAKKQWPFLKKHSLDVVSDFLKFKFKHHDALDDARACANVLIQASLTAQQNDPLVLLEQLHIKPGKLFINGYMPCSIKNDERKKR